MKKFIVFTWFIFIMIMIAFAMDTFTHEENVIWDSVSDGVEELSMWAYRHLRQRLAELGCKEAQKCIQDKLFYGNLYETERNDSRLAQVVEELGENANGDHAELEIIDIPDDITQYIDDYDGRESIHEEHRSW